ncbi:MAG: hypothetical protein ABW061_03360 [Polyangiaceae bacterium]
MKKLMKKVCGAFGLATVLATGTALAAGPWSSAVNIATIELDPTATGTSTYFSFASAPSGKPACGTSSQSIVVGPAEHVKAVTNLATAAFLAGKQVKVYWEGTCDTSYAKIQLITIL